MMPSATNSCRPLQATATRGVAGALNDQCRRAILLDPHPDADEFRNLL